MAEDSPETASTLKANAMSTIHQIHELAGEIARELEPVAGKPFVVFHDAYHYFETRFGLTAVARSRLAPRCSRVLSGSWRCGRKSSALVRSACSPSRSSRPS